MNNLDTELKINTLSLIKLLLRSNKVEEALHIEKTYQIAYPNTYCYFPNIKFTESYLNEYFYNSNNEEDSNDP
jgi:phage pi2 protein 07